MRDARRSSPRATGRALGGVSARLTSVVTEGWLQIGEVAETVGLSIRTIRHYDEMGVVEPSGRTSGGFRLYTHADVQRLRFVKSLKPLKFSLEEVRELLAILGQDVAGSPSVDGGGDSPDSVSRLQWFVDAGTRQCEQLRTQLAAAERVVDELRRALDERAGARDRAR